MAERKLNPLYERTYHLVSLYCKSPHSTNTGNEIRCYQKLRQIYSHEILENIDLPFKINTLGFFLSESGNNYISKQKRR